MSTKNKTLFSDFNPVSKQDWKERVTIDLKGEDFDRKLVWKNLSGINIAPFYNTEDSIHNLSNTGENSQALINYRSIPVQSAASANKLALKAIDEGVTGLLFDVTESITATQFLKDVNLDKIAVSFILYENEVEFAKDFFDFAVQNISNPKNLRGYFDLKVIANYTKTAKLETYKFDTGYYLLKLAEAYPNFKVITLSGTTFLDAGGNQVQEVAYTLNALVYLIERYERRDMSVETIFNNLHVQLAIGSEYFVEIGKFRAFNSLLHEVANKYSVSEFNHTLTAKTSVWSKSVTDAHTNLLRATTETMSAILGNVEGVLIDAYDKEFNKASDFSNRIANNIATILKEESYFGKVANPVDGAYYIEEVSTEIAKNALELFKEIEKHGGFYKAFENGLIQEQIAEIRQKKIKLISQRRLPMVGVNKYPNLMETVASEILSADVFENSKVLIPRRASLEIEAVRKVTEQLVEKTNKRPVVALSSFGNLTMRKARAAFSYDFIGVSGFNVLEEKSYDNADIAAKESANLDADVVIMCSSDPDYDESALDFVKTFRNINQDKVLLLAGNPEHLMDALKQAGLDGCINLRSDVIVTLSNIHKKIQKKYKVLEV
ncbi:hypothetical protein APS56_08035 [Pseudalgibacter alginicilyticus]|uniref:Methylmalonyl-CoA mutase alpha/beta chain catalytic domain-containing protein n=1 Tax=Pseudalgibacter alginicilyticus TaxID=1736674 RepID=A0A0P0DAK8_9FLAO|nr:methylmalonyl-CoA mutase subunit beta [Pseudalgibacter alginicilyticus]ALJ05077.1 hypothetical protein APS56_08035 [Pseudalgibacter alginicilyticus]